MRGRARVALARGGHLPLYHYVAATGIVQRWLPRGLGLGLTASELFAHELEEQHLTYAIGDVFLFVTDGITESHGADREEFGEDRLLALFATLAVGAHAGRRHRQRRQRRRRGARRRRPAGRRSDGHRRQGRVDGFAERPHEAFGRPASLPAGLRSAGLGYLGRRRYWDPEGRRPNAEGRVSYGMFPMISGPSVLATGTGSFFHNSIAIANLPLPGL